MPVPRVIIRSQSRADRTITVTGIVSDPLATVTASLPAASVPNGAAGKPTASVTLNVAGEFSMAFTGLNYGDYAPAIVTATNGDGSTTATSWPMHLFAPGTAAPGTPRVLLPEFVAPAFTAATVALGATVTSFTLESTSASNQANVPFTFGQPFKSGDLAPGDYLVGKIGGEADIPLQFNVKATHPNGSVRHALISGVLPALSAGASKTVVMARAASGTSTVSSASSAITTAGFSSLVNLTIGGTVYTADATPVLAAGMAGSKAWVSGALATEYSVNLPLKTAAGVEHADLTAQFNVRHYQGAGAARVDVTIEHTKAYTAISDVTYTVEVKVGGVAVYTIASALTHFPAARWKKTFWWNQPNPVHIRHNVPYLIGTKQIPNYDQSVVVSEATLASYATQITGPTFGPMGRGLFAAQFGGTGGRPELGLAPAWYAAAVLSQDKRAKALMLALADCAGSFATHRRDTSTGPANGRSLDVIHFPTTTIVGNVGDSKNTATGQYEKLPAMSTNSTYGPDVSHQAAFSYIPYLLTGDLYYLEELQFWANWNIYGFNPGYRFAERGLTYPDQVRGQAWNMRTFGQAAAITPDNDPAKARFIYLLDNNLSWYNAFFTDNPSANALGICNSGSAVLYPNYSSTPTGIGNFQDDFWTQAIGHVSELGHAEATRLLRWKVKWPVSRLIGAGVCWIDACLYAPTVKSNATGQIYGTIAEVIAASAEVGTYTNKAIQALPCNSPERLAQMKAAGISVSQVGDMGGYADGVEGFPSNLQPALAMAVDVGYPDADIAWTLFQSRTVKPDYGLGPQFAIVPRGYSAPELPPDPDPIPDPPPTGTKTMSIADRIKDSTTTTGTGPFALANAPERNFRPWLTAPITVGARVPYAASHRDLNEWEDGFGYLDAALVLRRAEVTASSNNNEFVNFSAGIKDVALDLTAGFVNVMAGAHNATATAFADPNTSALIVVEDGVPKLIKVSDAGLTFNQLPSLSGAPTDTDEVMVFRNGVEFRAPASYFIAGTAPTDTSAPVLTSATGSATGTTTATGSVGTNESTGTLYCLVATTSSTTATAIKGSTLSQAISSTGTKTFNITGLAASTLYYLHFLHRDSAGNDSAIATTASFTTGAVADTTSPTLTSPTGTQTGTTTASGSVTTNEGNGTLYRLASINATETVATVKAANLTSTVSATGLQNVTFAGLTAATQYYAHYVHRDAAGNESTVANSTAFTTAAVADTTAPTLTSPTGAQSGSTTATGSVSTNEANGTLYRMVSANATETAAAIKALNLTTPVTATGVQNVTFTGLTASTQYYAHYVHRDAAGNDSAVSNSAAFTTASADTTYTIAPYTAGNTVKTSITRASATAQGTTQVGFLAEAPFTAATNGIYWTVNPTPASMRSGWGLSSTTPPADINSAQNTVGDSSVNGLQPMGHPNTNWANEARLWAPLNAPSGPWFYWHKPVDGAAVCVNAGAGLMVT